MPALPFAVIGIALADSLNPTLIVGAMYQALASHPFRRTLVFTVAAFAVTLAKGLVVGAGARGLILALLPKLSRSVKWSVLAVVGVALVCGAGVLWWRQAAPSAEPLGLLQATAT